MRYVILSSVLVMLLLFSMVPSISATTPEWRSMDDMPGVRTQAITVELTDGRVLVTMGWDGGQVPSRETWIYDPSTDDWRSAADVPSAQMSTSGVAMPDGKVYFFGGIWMDQESMNLVYQEEVLIYDVIEDSWTTGATRPDQVSAMKAAPLDEERILVMGGLDSGMHSTDACYIYDTVSDTFEITDALPGPRGFGVAFQHRNDVYYVGGSDGMSFQAKGEVFRFDAAAESWSLYGMMPEGRYYDEGAMGDDGLLYLYGGKTGSTTDLIGTGTFRVMDLAYCSFVEAPEPPYAVIGAGVVATPDGTLLLLGGGTPGNEIADVSGLWIFERDAWTDQAECAPGEGVRVYGEVQAHFADYDSCAMDVVLIRDGTVLTSERMTSMKGETASVYLEVPEDLEPGTYDVIVRNVELDGDRCEIAFQTLTLNVTEAPSPTDRIGELEDELVELRDELAGKMDAWVGYALLIISLAMLVFTILSVSRRK